MATYYALIYYILEIFCIVHGSKATDQDKNDETNTDLKLAPSTYYSGWTDPHINSGYGVTGHGTLDNAYGAFDNYNGYKRYEPISSHGHSGGYDGYKGNSAYGGYSHNTFGYKPSGINFAHSAGYGGYGGYGGNGGLGSYLGYNNRYYNGANHLGYGYYKKLGFSGIYNNGITPSLVTGYRGYSKK